MIVPKNFRFSAPLHLRWADLDPLGHVNNAVFLSFFENGRVCYFKEVLENYRPHKLNVVIANVNIDYLHELKLLDSNVKIWVRTSRIGNSSFTTEYIVTSGEKDETTHCKASSTLVFFSPASGKPTPIDKELRKALVDFEKEGSVKE